MVETAVAWVVTPEVPTVAVKAEVAGFKEDGVVGMMLVLDEGLVPTAVLVTAGVVIFKPAEALKTAPEFVEGTILVTIIAGAAEMVTKVLSGSGVVTSLFVKETPSETAESVCFDGSSDSCNSKNT